MLKNAERHRSELKKMPKLEPLEMHKNVPKGKLMKERFGRRRNRQREAMERAQKDAMERAEKDARDKIDRDL